MIRLLTKYILTAAFRDKLLLLFLFVAVLGVSLSIFLGSSAITEKDQFSIVFLASSLRVGGLITLILFVVFYLRRSFESRDVEYLLSRPISRFQFLMAHSLAFSLLATFVAIITTLILMAVPSTGDHSGYLLWGLSIWAELLIMVNVALFFALILSSAVSGALACIAFYVLARMIGSILGIIHADGDAGVFIRIAEKVMLLISIFIPRLDLMGQSAWLIYGGDIISNLSFFVVQAVVFYGLLMTASFIDLKRRQF
jgi:hypothetical protein